MFGAPSNVNIIHSNEKYSEFVGKYQILTDENSKERFFHNKLFVKLDSMQRLSLNDIISEN